MLLILLAEDGLGLLQVAAQGLVVDQELEPLVQVEGMAETLAVQEEAQEQ